MFKIENLCSWLPPSQFKNLNVFLNFLSKYYKANAGKSKVGSCSRQKTGQKGPVVTKDMIAINVLMKGVSEEQSIFAPQEFRKI